MQDYGGSLSTKTGDYRSAMLDAELATRSDYQKSAPPGGAGSHQQPQRIESSTSGNYQGLNQQQQYSMAMMQQKNYGCNSKDVSDSNYCRVTGVIYESGMQSSHFQPPRYPNPSAPTFSSPPNSPLIGLVFDPTSPNYSGPSSERNMNADQRNQGSWPIANPEQMLPIGTGAKKKILKTQPDKRTYYSSDQRNQQQERYGTKTDSNDDNSCMRKNEGGTLTSESVSSLDFLVEGERMVSELCNIPEMSTGVSQKPGTKPYCFVVAKERNKSPESMEMLLNSLDKIIIHDQIPNEIVQLAIEACTDAENIAIAHHNRPCFKNIHSICAKTRSNVQKPDSAVANLHSQGIPWVIKNFIFSFVRILDGWKGVKELLSEKHDTFSRIENKYYSPNIRECFVQWQAVTKEMLSHIYKTFKCLDHGFTMEQKSFTHNYYANNPAAPRHQNQSKFQPPKGNTNPPRPINPQSYSVPSGHWMQNASQPGNQSYSEPPWPTRSTAGFKKFPPVPPPNSHNFYPVSDQNEVDNFHHKSQFKCEPGSTRETKPRQSWTITNMHDFRGVDTMCHADQRELYSQLKHKVDAELGKGSCQALINTVSNEIMHRRDMELKAKMIPLSHVEKTLIPSMASGSDVRACYLQKNNSCGDTKEESEFFTNWGQVLQKESSEFVTHQPHNTQVPSNVVSFSTNIVGPVQLIDPDNDDFHDISKVYMKPGSYKVPIKSADPVSPYALGAGSQDSILIYENAAVDNGIKMKASFPAAPDVPQSKYVIDSWPCLLSKRQDDVSFSDDRKGAARHLVPGLDLRGVPRECANLLVCAPSDRAWEAAKQSAPKLMDFIHEGSKSDTARLYDALGLSIGSDEYSEDFKQLQDSLEKEEGWFGNALQNPLISKEISDIWSQRENLRACKKELLETQNDNAAPNKFDSSVMNIQNSENSTNLIQSSINDEVTTTDSKISECKDNLNREPNATQIQSRDDISHKKAGGRPKVAASGMWYHPKKKKPIPQATSKKFEQILCNLSKMAESTFIQHDMDMKAAPRFYDVVKYPMCFNDITTKLKNSTYTDAEQVVHDFKRIFNNVRMYLKTYPDPAMKKNINKISSEFEKLFAEEFQNSDAKPGKPQEKSSAADEKLSSGKSVADNEGQKDAEKKFLGNTSNKTDGVKSVSEERKMDS